MGLLSSKVRPTHKEQRRQRIEDQKDDEERKKKAAKIYLMSLQILFKRHGGRRHPKLDPFETLMNEKLLTELTFVPRGSVIIYISHQWVGINHPDPRGDQFYHLVLLLERLLRGDVDRTDMDAFHSLLYKHNYTTTAEEWKRMLDPEKTFIFYDGFCVSKEERDEAFRFVPEIIKHCDFMIILAPGCTHFDKIDRRTGRKKNLCYRTYRLRAKCVFKMFNSFLTTKEDADPELLTLLLSKRKRCRQQ